MARPREFDEAQILDNVLHTFWRQGYEGTSLKDLMEATELTKSSIYGAFNSKADLFRKAGEIYKTRYLAFHDQVFAETTPKRVAAALLYGTADLHTLPGAPPGCFETNGALACSEDSDEIRREIIGNRSKMRQRLKDRFDALRDAGAIPSNDSQKAANFVITLIQGMAVQAKGGASREELYDVIALALQSWPD